MRFRSIAWVMAFGLTVSACATSGPAPRPRPFPGAPLPPANPSPSPASPSPAPAPSSPYPAPAAPSGIYPQPLAPSVHSFSTASFVETARQLLGVKYVMGGDSPATGFDCSGYVHYVYGLFRIPIPRTVDDQFKAGKPARNDIRAGDLLFFKTSGNSISHVALALGPDEFIHAPNSQGVVRIEKLSSPYWHARFAGARRIL